MKQNNDHDRIAIIGAGHVGSTAAYALMLRALVREIVLTDSDIALAEAEAIDISDVNALARPAWIWAGRYSDAATARLRTTRRRASRNSGRSTNNADRRLFRVPLGQSVAGRYRARLRSTGSWSCGSLRYYLYLRRCLARRCSDGP